MSDKILEMLIQAPLAIIVLWFLYKILSNQETIIVKILEMMERIIKLMKKETKND